MTAYSATLGASTTANVGYIVTGTGYGTGFYASTVATGFYYSGAGVMCDFASTKATGSGVSIVANSITDSSTGAFLYLSSSSSDATVNQKTLAKIYLSSNSIVNGTSLELSNAGAVSGDIGLSLKAGRLYSSSESSYDNYLASFKKSTNNSVTSLTSDAFRFQSIRLITSATTVTDDYDVMSITRNDIFTNAGSSLTRAGSVLRLENSVTASGALADTVNILEISQDPDSTGSGIYLTTAGTGKTAIKLDTGFTTSTAPTGASTYIIINIGGTSYKLLAQAT
jgi:hypothetical protein